jgi:hypothetical protein
MSRRKRTRRDTSLSSAADNVGATPSTASSPGRDPQKAKKTKFEERYNAEETSDADILGE